MHFPVNTLQPGPICNEKGGKAALQVKRSSDRVIKSRHKGLSRNEFNRGGAGILPGGEKPGLAEPFWTEGKGKGAGGSMAPSWPTAIPHCVQTQAGYYSVIWNIKEQPQTAQEQIDRM